VVYPISSHLSIEYASTYAEPMTYTTIEAEISHGRVTVKEPEKLPESGHGLLIVLPPPVAEVAARQPARVHLPLIQGDGVLIINPTAEELDASLWD
jgi:hypothetical protein